MTWDLKMVVTPENPYSPPRTCLWVGDHPNEWGMYLAANGLTHPSEHPGIHTVIYVEPA